jgi:hypothetical protein
MDETTAITASIIPNPVFYPLLLHYCLTMPFNVSIYDQNDKINEHPKKIVSSVKAVINSGSST